jgi:hypothetical protein
MSGVMFTVYRIAPQRQPPVILSSRDIEEAMIYCDLITTISAIVGCTLIYMARRAILPRDLYVL